MVVNPRSVNVRRSRATRRAPRRVGTVNSLASTLWNNRKTIARVGKFAYQAYRHYKKPKKAPTATSKIAPIMQSTGQHNDLSSSNVFIGKHKVMLRDRAVGKMKYFHSTPSIIVGLDGRQAVGMHRDYVTYPQLIVASVTRGNQGYNGIAPFQMIPNRKVTGASGGLVAAGAVPSETYLNIERIRAKIHIWNPTVGTAMEVHTLWCTPRHDTNVNPKTAWEQASSAEALGVATYTGASVIAGTPSVGSIPNSDLYGQYPTMHRSWNKMWRIVQARKINLQAGDSHLYEVNHKVNKKFSLAQVTQQYNNGITYIANVSVVPLFIVRGAPVNLAVVIGNGEPDWAKPELALLSREEWIMSVPKSPTDAPVSLNFTGNLDVPNVALTRQFVKDDDEGISTVTGMYT